MSSFKDSGGQQTDAPPGRPSLIERAFELARSGECRNKTSIVDALRREGYRDPEAMLHGMTMARQLREAISMGQKRLAQDGNP